MANLEIMMLDEGEGDFYAIWDETRGSIIDSFGTEEEAQAYIERARAYEKKLKEGRG